MSCGCKNVRDTSVPDAKWVNHDTKGVNNHVYKWFIFFTLVLFSPLFIPVIINFLYKLIIKNESFNATFMLKSAVELVKTYMIVNKDFDVDSADLEIYDENKDLELVNV